MVKIIEICSEKIYKQIIETQDHCLTSYFQTKR
jgi:hypothetical protein